MFEPNSIRSLLKKRNMTKLTSQNKPAKLQKQVFYKTCSNFSNFSKTSSDPDMEAIIEAKLMVKQIDHEVSNIRTWRQHQKQILQQKLQKNQQIFNFSKEEYQKYIDQKISQQTLENNKIIQKMKFQQALLQRCRQNKSFPKDRLNEETFELSKVNERDQDYQNHVYGPELMWSISETNDKINETKYKKSCSGEVLEDHHQAFLISIEQLSSSKIFNRKAQVQQQNQTKQSLNKEMLKKQLDDIDNELKQMEQLLND